MTAESSRDSGGFAEVLAAIEDYAAAVRRLDAQAVSDAWRDDAVLWAPGTEEVRGAAGALELLQGLYPQLTVEDMTVHSRDVDVRNDLAVERTTYTERVRIGEAEPRELRGRSVFVWRRQGDGPWKIQAGILNYASDSFSH